MGYTTVAAIVLILTVIIPILVIGALLLIRQRRIKGFEKVAQTFSFNFYPKDDGLILSDLGDFGLFSEGRKKVTNILQGKIHHTQVSVMDYRLSTGSGQNSFVQNQTVLIFDSKALQLPHFLMQPENVFQKMVGALGKGDINFSTHPTFSKHYHLKGQDFLAIRNLFNEKILNYFEIHQGWKMEGKDHRLVLFRAGKRVKPEELPAFLKQGQEILQHFEEMERS